MSDLRVKRKKTSEEAEKSESEDLPDRVDDAIKKVHTKLKHTIADLVRLLQLRKETGEEQPREVRVRWIDERSPTGA
jgi:hypothetical protein